MSDSSSSASSSSSSESSRKEDEGESLAAVNITVLCTSSVFMVYSLVQLVRIHVRARRLTAQQQSRARASAAVGVTTLAAAPVRFVGKALFHVFVVASMACKAAAVATEIFGPCGAATRWPAAPRVCWPLTEALYRVQNILLFLAYLDTCLAWSEYLDGASALLYGARWRRPAASTAAAARRHRACLAAGAALLAAATAAYVALLFVLHRADPADPDRAATTLDLASVTAVGVLYLASAVWIAVQCARFIGLTRRARRATAPRHGRRPPYAAYGTADGISAAGAAAAGTGVAAGSSDTAGAGSSSSTGASVAIGGSSSSGNSISGSGGADEEGGAGEGAGAGAPGTADERRSQPRQLGAMFALIIVCSVLLLVRAVWPVVAWLFTTETIGYSDWYNLGEHLLCEVVPLVCMCTLVFPLPRASVVRGYNGGTGIIVGTSVAVAPAHRAERTPAGSTAAAVVSAAIVIPVGSTSSTGSTAGAESPARKTRHGSVNSVYECVPDDDDDDERRGLLPHQSGARR